jgi:uncharacterized membrane protein
MTRASDAPGSTASDQPFGQVLTRNIGVQNALRARSERTKGLQERIADRITRFAGSMLFIYLHALFFGAWIALNVGLVPGPRFDPSLVVLAMIASVEAIFLSGFILISQNRMQADADRRDELALQMSLLSEHEITQIAELLDAIAEHLGVDRGRGAAMEETKQDVDPAAVVEAIEQAK